MRTLSVHRASDADSCGIVDRLPTSSGTCSQCDASGSLYSHLDALLFQVDCIIYQKHFSGTKVLPVALSNAAHV